MLGCVCCFNWSIDLMFCYFLFFFFKQKTAYEMRISDWISDVCSSDLQSRVDRRRRDRMAADRRGADRHGAEAAVDRDHRGDVGMSRHAIDLRMTAGGHDEFVSIVRTDGGKMLVAGDFSDYDQSQANHHYR